MFFSVNLCICFCVSATFVITNGILNVKMQFIDFYICHRLAPLRKLYSVTLAYFSRSNHSSVSILETVSARTKMRETTFIDFDICKKGAIVKFVLRDLDLDLDHDIS